MRWPSVLLAPRGRVRLRGVRTVKSTVAAVTAYVVAIPLLGEPPTRPGPAHRTARRRADPRTTRRAAACSGSSRCRSGRCSPRPCRPGCRRPGGAWGRRSRRPSWSSAGSSGLGEEIAEVPISATLDSSRWAGAGTAVEGRLVETVIGAAVGVVVGAAVAPPLYVRPASDAVQGAARASAEVLLDRRDARCGRSTRVEQTEAWLAAARGLGRDILRADRVLGDRRVEPAVEPAGDQAPARGRSQPAVRAGCHGAGDGVTAGRPPGARGPGEGPGRGDEVYGPDVREALSAPAVRRRSTPRRPTACSSGPRSSGRPRRTNGRATRSRIRLGRSGTGLAALLRHEERLARDQRQLHGQLTAQIDQLLRDVDSEARAELRRSWPSPDHPMAPALARPVQTARQRLNRPAG